MSSKGFYSIAALLLAVYLINGCIAIPCLSVTYDEADHLNYAMRSIKGHPEKVLPFDDASTMPISMLNAIPRGVEQFLQPGLTKDDGGISDIFTGRYMTLLLSSLIGIFILRIASELYGRRAGLCALFLFVFCPNLSGHAVLVTTDVYSALFTLTSAWYFRKAILDPRWPHLFLFGLHLGLAQLAKQSLTHLFIIYLLLGLFYLVRYRRRLKIGPVILKVLVVIAVVLLVINAGFQFYHSGLSLSDYHFRSSFFQALQQRFSFIGKLPLPLPGPYLSGLDLTKNIDEIGPGHPESSGNVYIIGQYAEGKGVWYYYLVVLFFKTPVPVLLLTIAGIYRSRKEKTSSFSTTFVFIAVIFYVLCYFSFFYNSQVGLRHILMIFPLWYVLLGNVAAQLYKNKWLFLFLGLYSITTFYYYFPNLIAYSNELLLPKRKAYKIMADSNIDYGQGYFFVQQYLAAHPDTKMAEEAPAKGRWLLGINDYLDLQGTGRYKWLRDYLPVRQVAHCYLLFDTRQDTPKSRDNE